MSNRTLVENGLMSRGVFRKSCQTSKMEHFAKTVKAF